MRISRDFLHEAGHDPSGYVPKKYNTELPGKIWVIPNIPFNPLPCPYLEVPVGNGGLDAWAPWAWDLRVQVRQPRRYPQVDLHQLLKRQLKSIDNSMNQYIFYEGSGKLRVFKVPS